MPAGRITAQYSGFGYAIMLGVDPQTPLTSDETRRLVDSIARQIVARRLEVPALLLIEMNRPLSFVASQALLCAMPMVGPIVGAERIAGLSKLLNDRENIDTLLSRIEALAAERDARRSSAAEPED